MTSKNIKFYQSKSTDDKDPAGNNSNSDRKAGTEDPFKNQKYAKRTHNKKHYVLHRIIPQFTSILGCTIIASQIPIVCIILIVVFILAGVGMAICGRKCSYHLAPFYSLNRGKLQTILLAFVCYQTTPYSLTTNASVVFESLTDGSADASAYWVVVFALAGSVQMVLGIDALVKSVIAVFRPDLLKEAE
jgi:hypothetical protein